MADVPEVAVVRVGIGAEICAKETYLLPINRSLLPINRSLWLL